MQFKTSKILVLLYILLPLFAQGQTKKVLFLGNSYTNANMLPQITADVVASWEDTLIFDYNTPGGYTLEGHSTNETSLYKIREGNWDFVVLQDQSQRPAMPLAQVQTNVFPYAHKLDSVIGIYSPCGETMFYMTWGRKNGDATYCPTWPPVCTYMGMDSLLRLRYMMMADSNKAVASPVGAVWRYVRQHFPDIELYMSDESHPSEAGSYAAACCFATAMFRKNPLDISYDFSLNATDALNIRSATKAVVYDSLLKWNIGEYDLVSDFIHEQIGGFTWHFTNLSQNANGQIWDFGSLSDTTTNPVFTFPGPGTFDVKLTSFNDCDTLVSSDEIVVLQTGVQEARPLEEITFYPNPGKGKMTFDLHSHTWISVQIFNLLGEKVVDVERLITNEIDLRVLNAGMYLLKISDGQSSITRKIIIDQ